MNKNNDKTDLWLDLMAAHVLEHGLNTASLRPLAKAAGTSDRMLIYHFGNKDGVIAALLKHLAAMFTEALSANTSGPAPSRRALVADVMALQRHPEMAGFLRIWFDILSAAAQGDPRHIASGGEILDGFLTWIETRLPMGEAEPKAVAKALLTLIEGMAVMDALGRSELADLALDTLLDDADI